MIPTYANFAMFNTGRSGKGRYRIIRTAECADRKAVPADDRVDSFVSLSDCRKRTRPSGRLGINCEPSWIPLSSATFVYPHLNAHICIGVPNVGPSTERSDALILLFPVLFFTVWFAATWVSSRVSGWRRLADSYGTERPCEGEVIRWQSAFFRASTHYNGCINFGCMADGLYVAPVIIVWAFHPPLLIPWSDISTRPRKLWLFLDCVELRFQRVPGVPMSITRVMAERLTRSSSGRFRMN